MDPLAARGAAPRPGSQTVVCSGSLPPGSPVDAYARVVQVARAAGLRSVVDATGEVLRAALREQPDVVSPNLSEAESLVSGARIEDVEPSGEFVAERAATAARGLVELGARAAIVSAGSHGAAFATARHAHTATTPPTAIATCFCPAPPIQLVNPIGAGDSLVGGLVHALEAGRPFDQAVVRALAVASASCEQQVAGAVDPHRADELAATITPRAVQATLDIGANVG